FLRQVHQTTRRALSSWPGLAPLHGELCRAVLAIRPRRLSLPVAEQSVETVVLGLLGLPADGPLWAYVTGSGALPSGLDSLAYKPFLPVPLWGEATGDGRVSPPGCDDTDEEPEAGGAGKDDAARKAAARRQQDQADRQDSLIFNRFEKILSLAEMINVNRDVDDDDEENAKKAASDMDEITLSKHRRRPAVKLKFDLDLAPEAVVGTPLDGERLYPEWDYRRAAYHRDHCRVVTSLAAEEGEGWVADAAARRRIQRVRRQFEALRPRHTLLHRQNDGDDLDLEAVVRSRCDLLANGIGSDQLFTQFRKTARDLSASFLVDVSLSTDAWVQNRRVLDVEKEALTTLCHGLQACGDEYAIHTFTSRRRSLVKVATVKGFDEPFGPQVTRRIAALKPGYYTRMGAAIRHVASCLAERPHRHRLLVLLTDGKPNDVDHYEGRYGIEDSRKAVQEARRAGIAVFGVTIDRKAQDYFPQLFGRGGYAIIDSIASLPAALPKIYRQLVSL
ncbi:MAG TPA: VWA domain-containing protein, partial [Rhodospirillaceae bacterium]|nr:VWA domain-containing protein [Rhodospirillaceae bacterium]